MSADPQTPLSQIWQGVFQSALDTAIADEKHQQQTTFQASAFPHNPGTTMNGSRSNNSVASAGGPGETGNNNYVNFNQFIMQHNLLGSNNGFGHNGADILISNGNENVGAVGGSSGNATNASATQVNVNGGGGGIAQESVNNDYFNFVDTMSNKIQTGSGRDDALVESSPQPTNLFSNSLFSPYNNSSSLYSNNDLSGGGYNAYNNPNTNFNYFDNIYTPFGNTGGYYMNPFATGFDFNASNLQASAPEFVPRFNNLSLNEEKFENFTQNSQGVDEAAGSVAKEDPKNFKTPPINEENHYVLCQEQNVHKAFNGVVGGAFATSGIEDSGRDNAPLTSTIDNNATLNLVKTDLSANSSMPAQQQQKTGTKAEHGADMLENNRQSNGTNIIANTNLFNPHSTASPSSSVGGAVSRYTGSANKQHLSSGNGSRGSSSNGFSRNGNDYNSSPHNHERSAGGAGSASKHNNDGLEKSEKPSARAERERERDRDARRYQNGRRSVDYHRSNKRRDDWNRNRDRINGFRVEEKYSTDNGKDSPLPSPEKKPSPKKVYPENEKLSQREKLIRDIETRRLECLVCVEPIKAHHGVWSCNNCYHVLHLQCIIKWASSSKSDDGWRCPACQNVVKEVPRDYYCFCGKVKNPPYTRHDIAHSCGDTCRRVEGCVHACTLLCHPGPCPPCQAYVKRECGCGKTTKTMQCCVKEAIECDSICGKLLNCELHTCPAKCHDGKCSPCTEKVDQQCHCAKQERQVACTRDSHDKHAYSCGKPCGKDLACGNHKCKDCCHPGECRTCKLSPEMVTSCPCGKMPIVAGQRKSCLDPILVCEGVCGKTLRCGKPAHPHHCTSKCHLGNCPPCNKQTAVKCRCGHMDQLIKCRQLSTRADDARCKKRCVKKRSCGKHKCNQECCIDIDHICPLPCNYTLSCGKHKCDQPCHRGNCPPCYRSSFEELYCECGAEVIYPPVPCGTKRPACKRPCSRTHPCQHPPQHNCHSAANCPPCMMFTTKWCFGQHEQRKTIPCSQESFSCGLACGKALPCGRHKCIKTCHEGVCQTAGEVCKQHCTKSRATCGHKCMSPCHDGDCPDTPCKEMVEVQCDCGNRKQMRLCHDLAREFSRIATAQLASSMAEMQRGNYMELSEILAPVKINKTNKTLDCNEECRLLERNRRLAIGLQIRNPDVPQKLQTKYSDFIRNFAKRDPTLVKSIHDALTNLVKLAKESKQKSRSHSFPTMNREKRQLVHEMCEMFGVESVAYDAEPNRNVVATAYKDRSWLPATSIMEVMQRESGQRRVPVPSNNAWGIKR
ncbi:protein shuttle craft [Anastrepha obliqua]|uniref:protein shuttle craft n=1 Tax=Anastrepha obliqua TaxID=95512 RepID=UPI00240A5092|nr:protein shuttle craft [Anastrepha obliqua]XP_054741462.1 protein shuttle craft [Anastrepha obliqua]